MLDLEADGSAADGPSLRLLSDLHAARAQDIPDAAAYRVLDAHGHWQTVSWQKFAEDTRHLAHGLRARGISAGMRVGVMLPTSLSWEQIQIACFRMGAVVVGLDLHEEPGRRSRMAATAALDVLVLPTVSHVSSFESEVLKRLRLLVVLDTAEADGSAGALPVVTLSTVMAHSNAEGNGLPPPARDALATIIFTSGSTGEPHAVAYTHAQMLGAVEAILTAFPEIGREDRLACWLPLSNLFQRILNFCAAGCGATTWFVEDPRRIGEYLPQIRPHVFIGVPRFFEKVQAGIVDALSRRPWWVRAVVAWALTRAQSTGRVGQASAPKGIDKLLLGLADALVLKKMRAVMGGEIRFLVSGSAPFPPWLLGWFEGIGLPVLEAYGLSENVIPVALNTLAARRQGTVGRVLEPNEVQIAADGEVLVRGPGCAASYLGESGRLCDTDGWLHTGDLGRFTADGFLCLEGRSVEIFKLSTGRKVAPAPVEAALRRAPGVDHAVLLGAGRKCTVAIVTLTPDAAALPRDGCIDALCRAIPAATSLCEDWSRPAGLLILWAPFSIAGGDITANLKLRRQAIAATHAAALDRLYQALERDTDFREDDGDRCCLMRLPGGARSA